MKKWFSLLILALVLIYRDSFLAPFFQDDKFFLQTNLSTDLFAPLPSFHYHPISNQIFYGLSKSLFGLNPLPFHLILFVFFALTLIAIFRLAEDLLSSKNKALATVFFYAFNVSLFALFYWTAISYFVFGTFFLFWSVYFFPRSTKLSLLLFTFGFLSNELALVFPALLFLLTWYKKLKISRLTPFVFLDLIFALLKILWIGFPSGVQYQLNFGQVLGTTRWYLLRAFNLPEGADRAGGVITILFLIFLFLVISNKIKNLRLLSFSVLFFVFGALPFLFLPNHMSAYYLSLSLFGPALFWSNTLSGKRLALAVACYLLLTILGLNFLSSTHWIILKNTGPIGKF